PLSLHKAINQFQRLARSGSSNTDVGNISLFFDIHLQNMMPTLGRRIGFIPPEASEIMSDLKSQFLQQPAKYRIELEAVAAAMPSYDFIVKIGDSKGKWYSIKDIEIFIGYGMHMLFLQSGEHISAVYNRARVSNTLKI